MAWVLDGEHEICCCLYSYDAQYHNPDSFRHNYVSDYQAAQAKTDLYLDYGYVSVYQKKDSLLFKATVEGNHLDTVWVNMTDKDVGLVEDVLTQAKKDLCKLYRFQT